MQARKNFLKLTSFSKHADSDTDDSISSVEKVAGYHSGFRKGFRYSSRGSFYRLACFESAPRGRGRLALILVLSIIIFMLLIGAYHSFI